MNAEGVGAARAGVFASHAQVVIMRTHHNVFVFQLFIFSGKDSDDIMGGSLHGLPIREVMEETLFLLSLHDRFQLKCPKLADNELRGECVAGRARVSAPEFLRSQELHRLFHFLLLLCRRLRGKGQSQEQPKIFNSHE